MKKPPVYVCVVANTLFQEGAMCRLLTRPDSPTQLFFCSVVPVHRRDYRPATKLETYRYNVKETLTTVMGKVKELMVA